MMMTVGLLVLISAVRPFDLDKVLSMTKNILHAFEDDFFGSHLLITPL
jgi:hypothetical protein